MKQKIELSAGGRTTYVVTGSGAPLLWFEGGAGFPAGLGLPDVELFADTFRAFLVDPPGVEDSVRGELSTRRMLSGGAFRGGSGRSRGDRVTYDQ
jgi:hypothetical protein